MHVINAVVTSVCITYTMLGGVKAVIWTDVMQAAVMVLPVVVVPALAVARMGGIGETWARAAADGRVAMPIMTLDLETRQTLWNTSSSIFLMWHYHVAFSQSCVQRLSSLSSLKHARM